MDDPRRGAPEPSDPLPDPLVGPPLARRLLALVRGRPGVSMREATRDLGASWAALAHHRRRLEQEGLLRSEVVGRRRVFYPGEPALGPTLAACHAMLRGETMRRVAAFVQANAPTDREEVARRLDLSPVAAAYHLQRLVAAGLVAAAAPGRLDALQPTPLLDLLLGEPPAEDTPGARPPRPAGRDDAPAP